MLYLCNFLPIYTQKNMQTWNAHIGSTVKVCVYILKFQTEVVYISLISHLVDP